MNSLSTVLLLHCSALMREWRNGRRASLRSWFPQGNGGSSPSSRTSHCVMQGVMQGVMQFCEESVSP
jgi:hypothetical protein